MPRSTSRFFYLLSFLLFLASLAALGAAAQDANKKMALFVKNRAAAACNAKVPVLQDFLVARLGDAGITVIAADDLTKALATVPGQPPADLEARLADGTSALRLAHTLGADYVLVVTLASYGETVKTFTGYGVARNTRQATLRATYSILDKALGATLLAGDVEVTATTAADANLTQAGNDQLNDLLSQAAAKIVEKIGQRQQKGELAKLQPAAVATTKLSIECSPQDLAVPAVAKDVNGDYVVGASSYKLQALEVTVEFNGVVIGSAPGSFEVSKGLNKVRLTRDGYTPWEQTVNVIDNMTLRVPLQMSPDGFKRWQQSAAFLEGLKAGQKLTDAQAEAARGLAQMLRQSGLRVEINSDLKGLVQGSLWGEKK